MTNALDIYRPETYETMKLVAGAMASSGYFNDSKQVAQAIVKVMAGAELGLGPFASMTGIHIIKGKPSLSANLIATLVKNDPRYDYRVNMETDPDRACALEWYENGKSVGHSSFTMNEAKQASLTGNATWQKYPSDMLFARAMTRGARRFAPGIFGGAPIYTPDELGAEVNEAGDIIEGEMIGTPEYIKEAIKQPEPVDEPAETIEGETEAPWTDDIAESEHEAPEEIKEQVIEALDEEDIDHFAAALEAPDLKEFAAHASQGVDGYTSPEHVVGAMLNKWPEDHNQKSFRFTESKRPEYLQWLADRKAEEA